MKKLVRIMTAVTILLFLSSTLVSAGLNFEKHSISEIVNFTLISHKRITKNIIKLTNDEEKAFWPIFEEYQKALSKVLPKFATFTKAIIKSEDKQNPLTDEQADGIIYDILDAKIELLTVQKAYMKKFRKVLPPKKVLLQVQIDEGITVSFRLERLSDTPLVQ